MQTEHLLTEIIRRDYNPELSFVKNAQKIIKENDLNLSVNTLRQIISGVVGGTDPVEFTGFEQVEEFDIPPSFYEKIPPFIIKSGVKEMVILSDIHLPYHDYMALLAALKYSLDRRPDAIYLNGDVMDMHSVSRFATKPAERNLTLELESGRKFFKELRRLFPSAKIFYKYGNHEERFDHFLWNSAPVLDDIVTLWDLLELKPLDIIQVDGMTPAKWGELFIIHGHELRGGMFAPVNIARTVKLRTLVNTVVSHHHQKQEFTQKDIEGKVTGAWSIGCLCGMQPRYMPINNWSHGFAYVQNDGKTFEVENKLIYNGRVI